MRCVATPERCGGGTCSVCGIYRALSGVERERQKADKLRAVIRAAADRLQSAPWDDDGVVAMLEAALNEGEGSGG